MLLTPLMHSITHTLSITQLNINLISISQKYFKKTLHQNTYLLKPAVTVNILILQKSYAINVPLPFFANMEI